MPKILIAAVTVMLSLPLAATATAAPLLQCDWNGSGYEVINSVSGRQIGGGYYYAYTDCQRAVNTARWISHTLVVCAPNMRSVIDDPKAAPRPSCRGLCMRTTKIIRKHTATNRTVRSVITMFMGRAPCRTPHAL